MVSMRCHIDTTYIDKFGNALTSWRSTTGDLIKGVRKALRHYAYEDRDILCIDLEVKEIP